jgi:hypothetical protein
MIPHGKKIRADHDEFLDDLATSLVAFVNHARSDSDLRGIFKLCTAAHTVLGAFDDAQPLMSAAAGVARRIALLSMIRQLSLVRVELRRLIECVQWSVYFSEHPVEREVFEKNPGRGWASKPDALPIEAAASADIGMFFRYAKERLVADPSGLGVAAATTLHVEYGNISGDVHAARGAVGGTLALAFDPYDGESAAATRDQIHRIFGPCVLLRVAADPRLLGRLDAINRDWFDWLVGKEAARTIRGEPFGIPR